MPHMRPITGSCGLASGSRKNAFPAILGASSVEIPSAVRAPSSARPVGVEGSAMLVSLTELVTPRASARELQKAGADACFSRRRDLSGLKTLVEAGEMLTTPGSLRYAQAPKSMA